MLNSLSLCGDITESIAFGLFDFSIAPSFLYYFYLPVFFLSLVISIFFLFFAPKNKINKYFLFSILVFSLWQINELVQWVATHNEIIFFSWQIIAILHPLMVFSVVLLIERLARKYIKNFPVIDDVSILFLSFIPIFVLMSGSYNFVYDISYCEGILGNLWIYIYFIELLLFLNLLYKLIKFRKSFISMKMFTYIFISSLILLSVFIFNDLIGSYVVLYEANIVIPLAFFIFLFVSSLLVSEFKILGVKLLLPQILISLLLFLNFSMIFIRTLQNIKIILFVTIVLTGVIGYILIKSVKKVEKQRKLLDVANKNQQNLLHFITHQVKGYMTKSRNIFDGILSGDYGKTGMKIKEVAKYGLDSETKGVETVQAILQASDLKNGVVEFDKQELDMRQLVLEQIENIKPKVEEKNLKIVKKIPADKMIIDGDDLKLKEVVKNLLENAVIYTPSGEIEISLSEKNGRLRFSVKDSGVGLTKEDKKNLFTEGGKGRNSIDQNVDTTGYGLFIARQIIREHGGHIWAESEGKGKGSEFIVELPK